MRRAPRRWCSCIFRPRDWRSLRGSRIPTSRVLRQPLGARLIPARNPFEAAGSDPARSSAMPNPVHDQWCSAVAFTDQEMAARQDRGQHLQQRPAVKARCRPAPPSLSVDRALHVGQRIVDSLHQFASGADVGGAVRVRTSPAAGPRRTLIISAKRRRRRPAQSDDERLLAALRSR